MGSAAVEIAAVETTEAAVEKTGAAKAAAAVEGRWWGADGGAALAEGAMAVGLGLGLGQGCRVRFRVSVRGGE